MADAPDRQPKPSSARTMWTIGGIATTVIAALAAAIYFGWPYLAVFADPERARQFIEAAGPWAPLAFIAMQIVQVLIAPIPGQVSGLVGGYLFGPFWGVVYTTIGSTIGFTLIFVLARRFGRPLVERFVRPDLLARFDFLSGSKGVLALFLVFLLPAFPDDIISFIAGLTLIPIPTLILVSLIGRLPGYIALGITGDGLTQENLNPIVVAAGVMILIGAVAYWRRQWLKDLVRQDKPISIIRQTWPLSPPFTALAAIAALSAAVVLYMLATVVPIQQ